jgi:hypothetical protein
MAPEEIEVVGRAMSIIAGRLRQSPGLGCANALAEMRAKATS